MTRSQTDMTGGFRREPSRTRHWISADNSSGVTAEPGRYRLCVSCGLVREHANEAVQRVGVTRSAVARRETMQGTQEDACSAEA